MSRRRNIHYHNLESWIREYAKENSLEFHKYNEYHMRVMYTDIAIFDFWSTAKYYVKETNYYGPIERGGETGCLETSNKAKLYDFLDHVFFAIDLV